jgi:hypothetical protein
LRAGLGFPEGSRRWSTSVARGGAVLYLHDSLLYISPDAGILIVSLVFIGAVQLVLTLAM